MTSKEEFVFLFKSYLEQAEADVKKWRGHLERLEGQEETSCDDEGLDIQAIRQYTENEIERAKGFASNAKKFGNSSEAVAWHHTILAYRDILDRL